MNNNYKFIFEDVLGHLFDANGKQLMTLQDIVGEMELIISIYRLGT